jgi:hypothetical protein
MLSPIEEERWQWTAVWLDEQILHFWGGLVLLQSNSIAKLHFLHMQTYIFNLD